MHQSYFIGSILAVAIFLLAHGVVATNQANVDTAFEQMSRFCFRELDCAKCADSFHTSSVEITSTIFDNLNLTNPTIQDVKDAVTDGADSLTSSIFENCEMLSAAAAAGTPRHILHTNFSGTADDQGVFVTTLYIIPDKLKTLAKVPTLADRDAPAAMTSEMNPAAQDWEKYIPETYRHFLKPDPAGSTAFSLVNPTKKGMGKIVQDMGKKMQGKYVPAFKDLEQVRFVPNGDNPGEVFALKRGGASSRMSPISLTVERHENNTTSPSTMMIWASHTRNNTILGTDKGQIFNVAEIGKMIPFSIGNNDMSPVSSDYGSMSNVKGIIPSGGFNGGVTGNFSPGIPSNPSGTIGNNKKRTNEGGFDFSSYITKPTVHQFIPTNWESFMPKDQSNDMINTAEESSSMKASVPHLFLVDENGTVHFATPVPHNEEYIDNITALKDAVKRAAADLQKIIYGTGTLIKDPVQHAAKNFYDDMRNVKQEQYKDGGEASVEVHSANVYRVVDLPDGEKAIAAPTSFYVETKEGKISRLEELPLAVMHTAPVPIAPYKDVVATDLTQIAKPVEEFWNKYSSGFCKEISNVVSTKFEGFYPNFDYKRWIPTSATVEGSVNQSPEKFMKSFMRPSDDSFNKEVMFNAFFRQKNVPSLEKSCEMAKSAGIFRSSAPTLHDVFYNEYSQHGLANVKFDGLHDHHRVTPQPTGLVKLDDTSSSGNEMLTNGESSATDFVTKLFKTVQELGQKDLSSSKDSSHANNDVDKDTPEPKKKMAHDLQKLLKAIDEVAKDLKSASRQFTSAFTENQLKRAIDNQKAKATTESRDSDSMNDFLDTDVVNAWKHFQSEAMKSIPKNVAPLRTVLDSEDANISDGIKALEKHILSYFKLDQNRRIEKMINFEAVEHEDVNLLSQLQAKMVVPLNNGSISLIALMLYSAAGLAIVVGWLWLGAARKKEGSANIISSDKLAPKQEAELNAQYFRMQDL